MIRYSTEFPLKTGREIFRNDGCQKGDEDWSLLYYQCQYQPNEKRWTLGGHGNNGGTCFFLVSGWADADERRCT